jgi:GT2 family glycosyltransferase
MAHGVSIVIPTWNGVELLKRFLPSVIEAASRYSNQSHAPTEIVIVDDASSDDTIAWLTGEGFSEKGSNDLLFIKNETNRGFGESCNRGFEAARLPLVFLINNDVEVDPDSIAPLVENFSGEDVFAVHCRVFDLESDRECGTGKIGGFARGFIRVHRSYSARAIDEESGVRLYSMFAGGGSAMFDRNKFLELGGFEPLLSPFYWEDVELSYRAWKRGFTVLYEPRSVTRHRLSSTIAKLDRRKVKNIQQRNRLIFHWINLHNPWMFASHIVWLLLLAVTAPLRLKPGFIASLFAALGRLPEILSRRREEKRAAKRADEDVFDVFAAMENRADV